MRTPTEIVAEMREHIGTERANTLVDEYIGELKRLGVEPDPELAWDEGTQRFYYRDFLDLAREIGASLDYKNWTTEQRTLYMKSRNQ